MHEYPVAESFVDWLERMRKPVPQTERTFEDILSLDDMEMLKAMGVAL